MEEEGGEEKVERGGRSNHFTSCYCPIPGMLVMKDLGIDVELYVSSEVDPDAIKVSMHKRFSQKSELCHCLIRETAVRRQQCLSV